MKYVCIWLIRQYQKYLSPLKRNPTCRFTPTCSAYAVEAFIKRGFFVGLALSIWRVLRCNPFGGFGYDPVPEKKSRKKSEATAIGIFGENTESDICNDEENSKK